MSDDGSNLKKEYFEVCQNYLKLKRNQKIDYDTFPDLFVRRDRSIVDEIKKKGKDYVNPQEKKIDKTQRKIKDQKAKIQGEQQNDSKLNTSMINSNLLVLISEGSNQNQQEKPGMKNNNNSGLSIKNSHNNNVMQIISEKKSSVSKNETKVVNEKEKELSEIRTNKLEVEKIKEDEKKERIRVEKNEIKDEKLKTKGITIHNFENEKKVDKDDQNHFSKDNKLRKDEKMKTLEDKTKYKPIQKESLVAKEKEIKKIKEVKETEISKDFTKIRKIESEPERVESKKEKIKIKIPSDDAKQFSINQIQKEKNQSIETKRKESEISPDLNSKKEKNNDNPVYYRKSSKIIDEEDNIEGKIKKETNSPKTVKKFQEFGEQNKINQPKNSAESNNKNAINDKSNKAVIIEENNSKIYIKINNDISESPQIKKTQSSRQILKISKLGQLSIENRDEDLKMNIDEEQLEIKKNNVNENIFKVESLNEHNKFNNNENWDNSSFENGVNKNLKNELKRGLTESISPTINTTNPKTEKSPLINFNCESHIKNLESTLIRFCYGILSQNIKEEIKQKIKKIKNEFKETGLKKETFFQNIPKYIYTLLDLIKESEDPPLLLEKLKEIIMMFLKLVKTSNETKPLLIQDLLKFIKYWLIVKHDHKQYNSTILCKFHKYINNSASISEKVMKFYIESGVKSPEFDKLYTLMKTSQHFIDMGDIQEILSIIYKISN